MITRINEFKKILESTDSNYEYIVYHSSNSIIDEFDFNNIVIKPNSSTRIDGIFFSDIPQKSWGEYIYKVKLSAKNPAIFDISKSRFDSLSVQEAFDALLRGDTSYMFEDLVEYGGMDESEAEYMIEQWLTLDLIVIENCNYARHNTEYIVPAPYYNKMSAEITILETKINESTDNNYVDLNTYDLNKLFNEINQKCFGGELALCPIIVKTIKGCTARYNAKINHSKTPYLTFDDRITISNLTHFTEEKLKTILCHEMIHYWVGSRFSTSDCHGYKFRENMYHVNKLGYNVTIHDDEPGEFNQAIVLPEQLFITGTYAKNWKFYILYSLTALRKLSQQEISRLLNDYVKNTKFEDVNYYVTSAPESKRLSITRNLTKFTLLKSQYNFIIDDIIKSDKTRKIIFNDIYSLNESINESINKDKLYYQ